MLLCFYASMLLCFYTSMLLCFNFQISPLIFLFELDLQATITTYNSTSISTSDSKSWPRLSLAQLSPGLCLSLFCRALDRISILIFFLTTNTFNRGCCSRSNIFPRRRLHFKDFFWQIFQTCFSIFIDRMRVLWGFALVKFTAARFFLIFAIDCRLG